LIKNVLGREIPAKLFDLEIDPYKGLEMRLPSGTKKTQSYKSIQIGKHKKHYDSLEDFF